MALEMRPCCENCGRDLEPASTEAYICSFECTFCGECAQTFGHTCPNCGGELVRRPIRPGVVLAASGVDGPEGRHKRSSEEGTRSWALRDVSDPESGRRAFTMGDIGMAEYHATIEWERKGAVFTDHRYSRGHRWMFDEGVEVPASSSVHVVPLPMSVSKAVDSEEALVASLSSCHMLWFLAQAAKRGFAVDRYRDEATGHLARNAEGKLAMLTVTLRPAVTFSGSNLPSDADIALLHDDAHENCFIANSVKTDVRCEPVAVSSV